MVNESRTLILNLPALGAADGERYIPPSYAPPVLPTYLRAARSALLGTDQTRSVLCTRVDRLLAYAHNCPLAADLVANDRRLTYDPLAETPGTVEAEGAWAFAAAVEGIHDAVFRPALSEAEARWHAVWYSTDPAPTRAVALALALAARIEELT